MEATKKPQNIESKDYIFTTTQERQHRPEFVDMLAGMRSP